MTAGDTPLPPPSLAVLLSAVSLQTRLMELKYVGHPYPDPRKHTCVCIAHLLCIHPFSIQFNKGRLEAYCVQNGTNCPLRHPSSMNDEHARHQAPAAPAGV